MKRIILAVAIMASAFGAWGCGGSRQAGEARAAVAVEKEANRESEPKQSATPKAEKEVHLCGAPTKDGGACKRHVRREGLHCWMHGGPSAAELDAADAAKK